MFDAEVRDLFVEMALDIEFALKNFDHDRKREQTEASLRKSEQHFRTIIETEPECIKVVDANGRLPEMNAAGLKILEAESLEYQPQVSLPDQRIIGAEALLRWSTPQLGVVLPAEFLQQQHCNEMQGYYFSKPVPEQPFRQLMLEVVS